MISQIQPCNPDPDSLTAILSANPVGSTIIIVVLIIAVAAVIIFLS